jgi:two-component system, OmpR family, KDP operon response regulator KdpE
MAKSVAVGDGTARRPEPARTVLVIEDEEPIRNAVRFILDEEGYAVLEAPNGRVGLDLLRANDGPLVVLLDQFMPEMSGAELLRAVAAEPELGARHAYIIFSASQELSAPTMRRYLPGKRLFDLPKPFDIDDLVAVVEQAARHVEGECDAG